MNRRSILHGVYGGLTGGVVFGILMGMMGMLAMIGKMMGIPSAAFGFLVHMMISAVIGAGFAVTLARGTAGVRGNLGRGLVYGGIWWLLGPLTLMPAMMGMGLGANWNVTAAISMLPSLMGHLLYGAILGAVYGRLEARVATRGTTMGTKLAVLTVALVALTVGSSFAQKASQSEPALGGYCPVAYLEMGTAVKGDSKVSLHHGGRHYLFTNADAKKMFEAGPAKYQVAYDGWCATAVAMGQKLESDPTLFQTVNGVTYLFSSADAKKTFAIETTKTIEKADAAWDSLRGKS